MPERPLALAIDLGGTKVDAALVDANGAVIAGTVHRAPTGPDAAREDIARAICRVVTRHGGSRRRRRGDRDRDRLRRTGRPHPRHDLAAQPPRRSPDFRSWPSCRSSARRRPCGSRSTARASPWRSTGAVPRPARRNALAMVVSPAWAAASSSTVRRSAEHLRQCGAHRTAAPARTRGGRAGDGRDARGDRVRSGRPSRGRARRGGRAARAKSSQSIRGRRRGRGRCGAALGERVGRGDRKRRHPARSRGRGDRGRLRTRSPTTISTWCVRRTGCRGLRLRAQGPGSGIRPRRAGAAHRSRRSRAALSTGALLHPSKCGMMSTCRWMPPTC